MSSGPLVLALHLGGGAGDRRAATLAGLLQGEIEHLELHHFPDGESLVRLPCNPVGRDVVLFAPLERPDAKLLPLLCAADTARELGARRIVLVAPYLPYMRQDLRFHAGEAITSHTFAAVLSRHFDFLVTVDPHLHRIASLNEIFSIPTHVVSSAASIATWISANVAQPVVFGPDNESDQWVKAVADAVGAPYEVLSKVRRGDRDVSVSAPQGRVALDGTQAWSGHTPVVVDDIVSSARTMIEAVKQIRAAGWPSPICIGVHALFAVGAYEALQEAGAARILSCNTVAHPSNGIDVLPALAQATTNWLGSDRPALNP